MELLPASPLLPIITNYHQLISELAIYDTHVATYASRVRAEKGSSGSMGTTFPDRSDQFRRYLEIGFKVLRFKVYMCKIHVSVLRFSVEIQC